MTSRPAIVVLAAGRGSRFHGSDHKLRQRLGATSVLGTTLRHAVASELPVVVVTTEALSGLAARTVAARDVIVVPAVGANADGDTETGTGMGWSIAAGVCARPHAPGWLILPGDMPMVQPSTLQMVARHLQEHPIAYAQYKGQRGHPVGFSAELYSELAMLKGDEGARRLVARYPAKEMEVDDPGVLMDLDTVDDLARVREAVINRPSMQPVPLGL